MVSLAISPFPPSFCCVLCRVDQRGRADYVVPPPNAHYMVMRSTTTWAYACPIWCSSSIAAPPPPSRLFHPLYNNRMELHIAGAVIIINSAAFGTWRSHGSQASSKWAAITSNYPAAPQLSQLWSDSRQCDRHRVIEDEWIGERWWWWSVWGRPAAQQQ